MTEKQKEIFDRITEIRDRMEDAKCEMALLRQACEQLKQERDAAIQRAEKAEATLVIIAERCRQQIELGEFSGYRVEAAIRAIHIRAMQESSEEKEVANV